MTTITETALIETLARPSRLDAAVTRMAGDEPTLTDISTVLHIIGTADDVDGMRIQALAYLAARALGKYDAWTRSAPPDALKDIVAESLQVCDAPSCDNDVAPWDGDNFCGPTCAGEFARATGDVR